MLLEVEEKLFRWIVHIARSILFSVSQGTPLCQLGKSVAVSYMRREARRQVSSRFSNVLRWESSFPRNMTIA